MNFSVSRNVRNLTRGSSVAPLSPQSFKDAVYQLIRILPMKSNGIPDFRHRNFKLSHFSKAPTVVHN